MNKSLKNPRLILFVLIIYIALVYIVVKFWTYSKGIDNEFITYLALISAIIWWGILLWALHHTAFQLISLFNTKNKEENIINSNEVTIAIVYPTCNDLDEKALESCLNQNFNSYQVYICDDSTIKSYRDRIDEYERKYSKCTISRRNDEDRKGFKAGNLNYAIKSKITQEWICLVDSDQFLESDYLSSISKVIPMNSDDIAFIQARNEPRLTEKLSDFQTVMKDEISLYYNRDLYYRNKYGFVPLLGHGALINHDIFNKLKGFPEVVSEDFAYALKAASKGYKSHYVKSIVSYESYPYDFGAFVTRLSKFSGASAELIRKSILNFLFSKYVSFTEKWDFTLMLSWYILMPLIVINGFISAYVTHFFWRNEIPYIHPILPYIYSYMLITLLVIIISTQKNNITSSLKFYFWTSAIYSSTLPISGFYFLKGLFVKPKFKITPKDKKTNKINKVLIFFVVLLGIAGIFFSLMYWSPFSWFLIGHSASYVLLPLFIYLNEDKLLSRVTKRLLIYFPGILMIIALIALWFFII